MFREILTEQIECENCSHKLQAERKIDMWRQGKVYLKPQIASFS